MNERRQIHIEVVSILNFLLSGRGYELIMYKDNPEVNYLTLADVEWQMLVAMRKVSHTMSARDWEIFEDKIKEFLIQARAARSAAQAQDGQDVDSSQQ